MTTSVRAFAFAGALIAVGLSIRVLSDILMPFVLGLAIAYLLDPVADRLERLGLGRGLATLTILACFFVLIIGAVFVIVPVLYAQIAGFAERLPGYIQALQDRAMPLVESLIDRLGVVERENLRDVASAYSGDAVIWTARAIKGLWGGGAALFNVLSLLFIVPLVAFYLLRDWDRLCAVVLRNVPSDAQAGVAAHAGEIDRVLAAFVRGQSTVCLALALIYGVGLSLVGLEYGLLIGVGAGLLSFVPYFGSLAGMVTAGAVGLAQFGLSWPLAGVAAVFLFGQTVESFWLAPHLVGGRVCLHPVWVIFALMAGGTLFGLTGVLLAVPTAAAAGVLLRNAFAHYRGSRLYGGDA